MSLKTATKWMSTASLALLLAACGGGGEESVDTGGDNSGSGDAEAIHVITRESGSGTRTAFVEIAGVEDADGEDAITQTATVQNGTNAVMQGVAGDESSIGYISLGSVNDSIKALAVNGVEATAENVASGEYAVARNFNVTYGGELSNVAADFWEFMDSAQAQEIVEDEGYVSVASDAPEYEASGQSGQITIVGSTSVQPVIERFAEAYKELNPDVTIEITAPGSGAGVTAAIDGTADIGMASRELDDEEQGQVSETKAIAVDGIAVIVHTDNALTDIALEDVGGIYLGEITNWDAVQ